MCILALAYLLRWLKMHLGVQLLRKPWTNACLRIPACNPWIENSKLRSRVRRTFFTVCRFKLGLKEHTSRPMPLLWQNNFAFASSCQTAVTTYMEMYLLCLDTPFTLFNTITSPFPVGLFDVWKQTRHFSPSTQHHWSQQTGLPCCAPHDRLNPLRKRSQEGTVGNHHLHWTLKSVFSFPFMPECHLNCWSYQDW